MRRRRPPLPSADVRAVLHLQGSYDHLFELLCAHGTYDHTDRHLATHCATLHRKEEGHVLVNGHPAFQDSVAMAAIINEPGPRASANMKMVQSYARLLDNDDPLMVRAGLKQPHAAVAAWKETILPPEGGQAAPGISERMTLYATTRKSYGANQELTVDYGRAYLRNYSSGAHKPTVSERRQRVSAPPEAYTASQLAAPRFPQLPGWFNPGRQPPVRPAFERSAHGKPSVAPDHAELVAARREALGLPADARQSPAIPEDSTDAASTASSEADAPSPVRRASLPGSPATPKAAPAQGGGQGGGKGGSQRMAAAAPLTPKVGFKRERDDDTLGTSTTAVESKRKPDAKSKGAATLPAGGGLFGLFPARKRVLRSS